MELPVENPMLVDCTVEDDVGEGGGVAPGDGPPSPLGDQPSGNRTPERCSIPVYMVDTPVDEGFSMSSSSSGDDTLSVHSDVSVVSVISVSSDMST